MKTLFMPFGWLMMAVLPFMPAGDNVESTPLVNQPDTSINDFCEIQNHAFRPGEELTYKLFYNWKFVWLAAGEVTFKVEDYDEDHYYVSAVGKSYANYDWFYEVRDKYECYVDKHTLLPTKSIRNVHEGKYRLYDRIIFDHENGQAASLRGKSKEVAEENKYDIESCVHDILSIIYHARNVDFDEMKAGDQMPIQVFIDKKTWPLTMSYYGKKSKRIKGHGKFDTIEFGPEVIEGYIFSETDKMKVYVSDDENQIPLLIESPIKVGSVKVVLKDYKNLRHALTSSKRQK